MVNSATFFFVDQEESESQVSLWLPPALDLADCMDMALDYTPAITALSDCGLETVEIARYEQYAGIAATATRPDTASCLAIILETTTDHVLITIPAWNSDPTSALVAELLSSAEREIVSETSGEPVVSFLCEYPMTIPIAEKRSG